ncbi:hypothetical protein [Ruegeria sp.]|uniref:hypothetical protein n=1 Tax=Ruegeria sp. TaxID=1879320 RepID=UPI003B5BCC2F
MPVLRAVLGYLAALYVGALIVLLWDAPNALSLLVIPALASALIGLMVVLTLIPAFVLRITAIIFHLFNPVVAIVAGAITSVFVYWSVNAEGWAGAPQLGVWPDLLVYGLAGGMAGLTWYWVESFGAGKNEEQ